MAKNIALYFTHKESLGHSCRVLNIITALKKKYGSRIALTVFQAGKPQGCLAVPEGVRWVNLPVPFFSRASFYQRKGGGGSSLAFSQERQDIMLSVLRKSPPDLFITEFFPFGRQECRFELLPVITFLKKQGVALYATIGYPFMVRDSLTVMKEYAQLYDRFLIHTPPGLEDPYLSSFITYPPLRKAYQEVLEMLAPKITYTGYILPSAVDGTGVLSRQKGHAARKGLGLKKVLVSRGGGVIYPKIITNALIAAKRFEKDAEFSVVCGPATSKAELAVFMGLVRKYKARNTKLIFYTPDFPQLMKNSDVSVSMAGYNTAVQLLYYRKPAVLLPSSVDPEIAQGYCSEQLSRAQMLKERIGAEVLDYRAFSADEMETAVRQMLGHTVKQEFPKEWFGGAAATATLIAQ